MSEVDKKGGIFSIALLSSGNILGMVISAVALILYSRYMGPTEFGLFSVAFAFMQIVVRLADYGTNMAAERAIARVYDQGSEKADVLIRTTLWLKAISFVIFATISWFSSTWISTNLLHINQLYLIKLAIILSGSTVIFEYATLIWQATHRFALVAQMTIAQALGKLIFSLILIWQGMLDASLGLLIYGLMPGLGAILGFMKNPLSSYTLPPNWRPKLKLILSVAKWTAISAVAMTIADNLDILMVQSFMTSFDVGIWSGIVRIATFANLIGWSIGSVLNVRVARYHRKHHLDTYLNKAWKLSILVFLLLLASIPLSSLAIKLTIGSSYLVGTIPLQIILISIALSAATAPFIALFYVFDKPSYYGFTGLIQIAMLAIGDYYLIPLYGLNGSAWVRVIVRFVILVVTLCYAKKSYDDHFREYLAVKL